jgi:predicted nucleic acid-binding protein
METRDSKTTETSPKESPKLSLADKAKAAVQAAKDGNIQKKQEEQEQESQRVEGLLTRLKEIDSEFKEVEKVINSLRKNQREEVRKTLKGDTDVLANEENKILDDEGVQLVHIKELTNEVPEIKSWDELNDVLEEAVNRGWFENQPRNAKGHISLETLSFPNHKNPELRRAMANLKKAVSFKVSDMVRLRQEKEREKGKEKK